LIPQGKKGKGKDLIVDRKKRKSLKRSTLFFFFHKKRGRPFPTP